MPEVLRGREHERGMGGPVEGPEPEPVRPVPLQRHPGRPDQLEQCDLPRHPLELAVGNPGHARILSRGDWGPAKPLPTLHGDYTLVVLAVKSNSRSPATHPLDSGGSMLVVPLRTPEPIEAMKTRTLEGFGKRLAELRQQRGITMAELGTAVGD